MAIRVLMLIPSLRVATGTANYAMNYFRAIDPEKVHLDFAVWTNEPTPYYDEIRSKGCRVWFLPSLKRPVGHFRACHRILSEGCYDIVHDNTLLISYPMMLAAVQRKVPVRILHCHSSRLGETMATERRNRLFLPLLKKTATDYAACSSLAAKAMFGKAEYSLIPNVINASRYAFSPAERQRIRAEMGLGDRIVVGTVARTAPPKNPLFALKLIEKLIAENPRVEYWWIGSGPMDAELKARIELSAFRDHIRLLGSREDVPDLYQAMDVFFQPSLFEGLMIAGIEAQAMGLPCVVSSIVPQEFAYSDLVYRVNLCEPLETWVGTLLRQTERRSERRSYSEELENSMFSDRNAGQHLWEFYSKALDRT